MIIAVVGSGGKTSTIKKIAQKYASKNKKVFITTSTHMFVEPYAVISDSPEEITEKFNYSNIVMAGKTLDGEKLLPLSQETYKKVCEYADIVLIEADGSKMLPLKFPADYEPVIYDNVDKIIVITGLNSIGEKMKDVCHRFELAKEHLSVDDDTIVTADIVYELLKTGYLLPLKEKYPDKEISVLPCQCNNMYLKAIGEIIKENADILSVKQKWFTDNQKLFICGAGHIAKEVTYFAKRLGFNITVMDDRAEFANKQELPFADNIICDTFENLKNYLNEGSFYVVVTRGHKDDFLCVNEILKSKYSYVGMIGSKAKVERTKQQLEEKGFSQEDISKLHSPIGLKIKAVTPSEIAVSILGEIILEKNSCSSSSVSQKLIDCTKNGTLCIITEKHGSSPRGVGSMMFVCDDEIIDSIGGGAIENAVIQDAKNIDKITFKNYSLSAGDGGKLGMVCGGENTIMFIPIKN